MSAIVIVLPVISIERLTDARTIAETKQMRDAMITWLRGRPERFRPRLVVNNVVTVSMPEGLAREKGLI